MSSKSCKCSYFSQCEAWVNKIHQAINILIHFSRPDRMNFSDVPLKYPQSDQIGLSLCKFYTVFHGMRMSIHARAVISHSLSVFLKMQKSQVYSFWQGSNQSQMMCYSQCIPSSICGAANADKDIWGTQGSTRT